MGVKDSGMQLWYEWAYASGEKCCKYGYCCIDDGKLASGFLSRGWIEGTLLLYFWNDIRLVI